MGGSDAARCRGFSPVTTGRCRALYRHLRCWVAYLLGLARLVCILNYEEHVACPSRDRALTEYTTEQRDRQDGSSHGARQTVDGYKQNMTDRQARQTPRLLTGRYQLPTAETSLTPSPTPIPRQNPVASDQRPANTDRHKNTATQPQGTTAGHATVNVTHGYVRLPLPYPHPSTSHSPSVAPTRRHQRRRGVPLLCSRDPVVVPRVSQPWTGCFVVPLPVPISSTPAMRLLIVGMLLPGWHRMCHVQ